MAQKKSRPTFEKLKREQALKERRARKQERKAAARLAKASGQASADPALEMEGKSGHESVGPPSLQ
jgi:hypothetical protein